MNYKIYMIIVLLVSNYIQACAVCFGEPDDPVTIGMNNAIMFLLCTILFVLSCIIYSIIKLIKKSKNIES